MKFVPLVRVSSDRSGIVFSVHKTIVYYEDHLTTKCLIPKMLLMIAVFFDVAFAQARSA